MADEQDYSKDKSAAATSLKRRLFWLLACVALGLGIGLLGHYLTSNPKWFLAVPAVLAVGWLFFANPTECTPGQGCHHK